MSDYQFDDLGGGRFAIRGKVVFDTVSGILADSKELFAEYSVIKVDLSGIEQTDSAGLALLLEWINWAKHYVREIRYFNVPDQIRAIAEISEVDDMLHAGERWTAPVDDEI